MFRIDTGTTIGDNQTSFAHGLGFKPTFAFVNTATTGYWSENYKNLPVIGVTDTMIAFSKYDSGIPDLTGFELKWIALTF